MKHLLICAGLSLVPWAAMCQLETANASRARAGLPPIDTVRIEYRTYPGYLPPALKIHVWQPVKPLPPRKIEAVKQEEIVNEIVQQK